jgi:phage repressor protein C with HTH and peptisase S24 domain
MRKGLGEDKLNNVLNTFPQLSRNWLLFGEGDMLNNPPQQSEEYEPSENIRYWEDVSATGGCKEFLENPDEHEVKMISVPRFADCTDAVNIYGDSMYPVYKSGEIILIKPWKESFIDYGYCYLIVTKNGNRMVKYLRRSEHSDKVLCVSENKQFDPFEIDRSDILRLFLVRGSIKADTI